MVPASFTQCLVVMAKDLGVDVYVPAMYVLLDSKDQDAYWNALSFVIIHVKNRGVLVSLETGTSA
ncbi:hypothetical protein DVH05_015199 [Phytophthora capsici]|nr:hypothetical protein DVH05_015199 [Phytophthora capsici]